MTTLGSGLDGDQKAQLLSDALHAITVSVVVVCVTIAYLVKRGVPADVLSGVYLGAIGYAAARAGTVARTRRANGTQSGGSP